MKRIFVFFAAALLALGVWAQTATPTDRKSVV